MTITADFSGGEKTATTEPLYQWDTGQKLALSGLPATSTDIQVHFANAAMAQAIVKATATENSLPTCDIPNEFLQFGSAAKARAWVYYKEGSSKGYTIKTVLIPITPRKRPNDYVSPEDPDSQGIVDRALELLEHYQSDLDGKAPLSTAYTFDSTTANVTYNTANPKTIYLNATVDDETGIVITAKDNDFQYFLGRSGTLKIRYFSGGTSYSDWTRVTEHVDNKKTTLTGNESSNDYYPTTKAVADALNTKAPLSTAFTFDTTTTNVVYNIANPKKIYTNAYVNGKNAFVLTTANNYYQIALCCDGTEYVRELTAGGTTTYKPWVLVNNENTVNKISAITASNKTSTDYYPSIKAVVDYLVANYEDLSNKLTSEEGIDSDSTDTQYPTAKAVYDLGVEILGLVNDDISNVESRLVLKESASNKQSSITAVNKASTALYPSIKAVVDYLVANYETLSNKLTSVDGIDANSTDNEYPTAKAVFDLGVQIVDGINEDITETNANLSDLKAYIGYTDGDILGLHADFENKVFTRLGAAVGLNAGSDFNAFPMYGQRRRVVVDSNGVIIDGYSPEDVGESDTDVDVMVYQPKFYYKVVPLKLEKQSRGLGYHIRKANYYISSTPHAGFKLHPLFFDKNGNEIDYVLFSAYEASYMWRRQFSTNGYVDTIFHDGVDTDATIETGAVLKSLPGVKPISGQYKAFNKTNAEILAQNKSSNWHLDTIQSVSANQLLMAIEYGTFNTQAAIGMGIVNNSSSDSNNCSSLTGSTSAETFNTASGMASETIYDAAGTETPFNTNGKVAVSYRGMENPWGNIWKHVNGINIWGDGTTYGGQTYISDNFNFNEEVKGETTINNVHYKYSSAGFSLANASGGWISAFGYGKEEYDWLLLPSETTGNSSVPVSDNFWSTPNLNGYRIALLGGCWNHSDGAGGFFWNCRNTPGVRYYHIGGRLLFVPTAQV